MLYSEACHHRIGPAMVRLNHSGLRDRIATRSWLERTPPLILSPLGSLIP